MRLPVKQRDVLEGGGRHHPFGVRRGKMAFVRPARSAKLLAPSVDRRGESLLEQCPAASSPMLKKIWRDVVVQPPGDAGAVAGDRPPSPAAACKRAFSSDRGQIFRTPAAAVPAAA